MSEKFKSLLDNEKSFKLVSELDGKRIRVLMDNENSFKLIDPKTGKNIRVMMDNDQSFRLVSDPNLMSNEKSFVLVNTETGEETPLFMDSENSFKYTGIGTEIMDSEKSFKLVDPKTGEETPVLMDSEKSFKLVNPKTGEEKQIFMDSENSFKYAGLGVDVMDNEKSFKLVDSDGQELGGNSFRLMTDEKPKKKTSKKKMKNEKILVLVNKKKSEKRKKNNGKSKFEKFFTEPSFNLLEIIIAIILVGVIIVFITLWAKDDNEGNEALNDPTKGYEAITDSRLTEFIDLYTDVITNYYQEVDSDELLDTVTKAMLEYLGDSYTGYMDEYEARNLKDRLEGSYNGLGFEIATRTDDEAIVITGIFEGSPASKTGIQTGDVIKSVNEIDVTSKNSGELSLLIKDKLTGIIRVVVERGGKTLTFDIEKGVVTINSVTSELFGNVGYIKIDTFSKTAVLQVQNALSKLEKEGMTSLVVDVRNNEGGYLDSAYNIADLFIKKNKVIYKLQTNEGTKVYEGTAKSSKNYKVAVLINGGSASASEVFALAMKDSYGATLVGSKSYGKGTVQETTELSTGSLVKYTVAKWLGPNGESINEVGIVPEVLANLGAAYMKEQTYENDGQLQRAIKAVTE